MDTRDLIGAALIAAALLWALLITLPVWNRVAPYLPSVHVRRGARGDGVTVLVKRKTAR